MNIQDATKKALSEKAAIFRILKKTNDEPLEFEAVMILPGNSHDACVCVTRDNDGRINDYCRNWNPTVNDLVAEDWEVLKP